MGIDNGHLLSISFVPGSFGMVLNRTKGLRKAHFILGVMKINRTILSQVAVSDRDDRKASSGSGMLGRWTHESKQRPGEGTSPGRDKLGLA